jgi:5-methylthioadenosine/S-adenosylhomocysteine deaminase
MEQIDLLLVNAHILTMNPEQDQFNPGAIAIQSDKIIAIGSEKEIKSNFNATETFDCGGKLLMPGLINAHTHVPMTLLRGLADDLRLDVWLMGYMMPVEREFVSPDFVSLGTRLACAEMIRSGVTTFADMYYFEDDVARATAEVGMRGVCGESVMKFPTPDAKFYEESLEYSREFIKKWKNHPLIVPSIAPHAPYTCTPEILRASAELAVEYDIPLQIHISETQLEVENMRREQGMPVVPWVKKQGLLEAKVLAAHCVWLDDGEMRTLLHAHAGVAHNPSSNLKLASGAAPVKRMLDSGLNVGIGTDGPASNNDLDMFEEVRLAAFLAKTTSNDPTALPAQQALHMATLMGAKALHIADITGSLETGKRADLIIIDLGRLHNSPHFQRDPHAAYAQIVYSAKSSDVTDVMVNGTWLMRDRELITVNEDEILKEAGEYARKIDLFLVQREESLLSKLIAVGGLTEEESFEVQAKTSISDPDKVITALEESGIDILRRRHYHEYDTYFLFADEKQGLLRYREDHFIDDRGQVSNVRSRLTLIGEAVEYRFPDDVLLSRSRYLAHATQSLRFYREYFRPVTEIEVEKDRQRFLVNFHGEEFFINIDKMLVPSLGSFLEIKSRTWSKQDADLKSKLSIELIKFLNPGPLEMISKDYFELIKK